MSRRWKTPPPPPPRPRALTPQRGQNSPADRPPRRGPGPVGIRRRRDNRGTPLLQKDERQGACTGLRVQDWRRWPPGIREWPLPGDPCEIARLRGQVVPGDFRRHRFRLHSTALHCILPPRSRLQRITTFYDTTHAGRRRSERGVSVQCMKDVVSCHDAKTQQYRDM